MCPIVIIYVFVVLYTQNVVQKYKKKTNCANAQSVFLRKTQKKKLFYCIFFVYSEIFINFVLVKSFCKLCIAVYEDGRK